MFDTLTATEALALMSKLSLAFRATGKLASYTLDGGYGYGTHAYQMAAGTADELHALFMDVADSSALVAA